MTEPLCMWTTNDATRCIGLAKDLQAFDLSRERSSRDPRGIMIGDRQDAITVHLVSDGRQVEIEIVSDDSCFGAVTSPPTHDDVMGHADEHIGIVAKLLSGVAIHSKAEPDIAQQERTNDASDIIKAVGGAIAHRIGAQWVTLSAPSPWGPGLYRTDGDDIPLDEEWEILLSSLLPPLYAVTAKASLTDMVEIGRHWQYCSTMHDPVGIMRLHAHAAEASGR